MAVAWAEAAWAAPVYSVAQALWVAWAAIIASSALVVDAAYSDLAVRAVSVARAVRWAALLAVVDSALVDSAAVDSAAVSAAI